MEHALMCPQCNAPLALGRFARTVVCSYCGATVQLGKESVSAKKFKEAFRTWNSPESYQIPASISLGENHWATDRLIAKGDTSDVYAGRRARWPTELVLMKILRDGKDKHHLDNEWMIIQTLQRSQAPGADFFTTLIPQPVAHGNVTNGQFNGKLTSIFRLAHGFNHTFENVIKAYPNGISPRASVWIWRRILEVLTFLHNSGFVHGAVLPSHLLVQDNEHGIRLVGYGAAGQIGKKIHKVPPPFESFYPKSASHLTNQLDLTMSARCLIALLGGNPADGSLPKSVPEPLTDVIQRVALTDPSKTSMEEAWAIREELGAIANEIYGAPQFIPIVIPS